MATVVNAGLEYLAKLMNGVSVAEFKYLANGSGSTAEGNTQTALVTENTLSGSARAAATCTYVADYKAQLVHEWTFSGNVTVREIGIFDTATSGGNMFGRHLFAADKTFVDTETWELTVITTMSRA